MRHMPPTLFAWMTAVVLWSAPCPAAENATDALPPRIDFALRDVQYQPLPSEVCGVRVGPDDRVWLETRQIRRAQYSEWRRRLIEREFSEAMPQLMGITPTLFEPGGRVWFLSYGKQILTAYDGKTWIEKVLPEGAPFTGDAILVDGCAMFTTDAGVWCYDGKDFVFQDFFPKDFSHEHPRDPDNMVRLLPQADGKTVLALARGYGLWRWRGGEWSEMKLPAEGGGFRTATPWADGLLILPETGVTYIWNDGMDPAAEVAALVAKLGDADFKVREAATQSLIRRRLMAPTRQALEAATDPEIRVRLKRIVEQIEPAAGGDFGVLVVGKYRLEHPYFTERSGLGVDLVWARQIVRDGQSMGPGLALITSGGEVQTLLGGSKDVTSMQPVGNVSVMPDGSVWCDFGPRRDVPATSKLPAHRVDVKEGKFVDDLAGQAFGMPMAGRRDGLLFFRVRHGFSLVAYKASAADDCRFIEASAIKISAPYYGEALAPDGTVWASFADNPNMIRRYDGKQWREVPPGVPIGTLMPGLGGVVLVNTDTLLAGEQTMHEPSLEALIQQHRKEFVRAFPPGGRGYYEQGESRLVVDKGENVWLFDATSDESRWLKVLVGDAWLDVSDALVKAGWDAKNRPDLVSAVGDSSKVVACKSGQDAVFFMEVKDGKLAIEKRPVDPGTPPASPATLVACHETFRDPAGALWIIGSKYLKDGSMPNPRVDLAVRITQAGLDIPMNGCGKPWLADQGGNLWLVQKRPHDVAEGVWELNVCREGKVACTLSVPGLWWDSPAAGSFAVSDRAGSVWVWSQTGLYHLTADDPAAPAKFALKASYFVRGVEGQVFSVRLSPLGFLVVRTFVTTDQSGRAYHAINLVPLPKD